MILISSVLVFEEAGKIALFQVLSTTENYRVSVTKTEVEVIGPDVNLRYDEDDIPPGLSNEARAVLAVLLVEEGE